MSEAAPASDGLGLILGYDCRLRCAYCPVAKGPRVMTPAVLDRALDVFAAVAPRALRLFGADPLDHWDLVRRAVARVDRDWPDPAAAVFEITTNGQALNDAMLDVFAADARFRIVVSVDGARAAHERCRIPRDAGAGSSYDFWARLAPRILALPGFAWVNMVIAPETAGELVANFTALLRQGARAFNLLPAYYQPWPPERLAALEAQFAALAAALRRRSEPGRRLRIVNAERVAPEALYRRQWTVDWDGAVFDSDMVMTAPLMRRRDEFSRGNVLAMTSPADLRPPARADWTVALHAELPPRLVADAARVDAALTAFVEALGG